VVHGALSRAAALSQADSGSPELARESYHASVVAGSTLRAGPTGSLATEPRRVRRRAPGSPPERPPDAGDGGGDDGSGWNSGERPQGIGTLALALAMAGITTLFLVLIAVWLLLRRPAPDWPLSAPAPAVHFLWISTSLLLASSAAVERAARMARALVSPRVEVRRWLALGVALGIAFVCAQVLLWRTLWSSGNVPASSGYAAVFFAFTGLHALHVVGGLLFLGATAHALGKPNGEVIQRGRVRLGALYWHFMGGIWLVLFVLLYVVR